MAWPVERHNYFGEGILQSMAANNPEYPEGHLWDMLNMVYIRDSEEPEKMMGYARLGSTDMGGRVTGLFDYAEGTRLIATCSDGKIYERTSGDWSQATGGTGFDSNTDTRWSGTMFYGATTTANLLILGNGIDTPKRYDSSNGVAALGGGPPSTGNFPVSFLGRCWMASGDILYYSAVGNCEDWTTAGGNIQVERGSGNITGLYIFMGELIIFKRTRIYRMLPTTRLSEAAIRRVSSITGTPSHQTIQEIGQDGRNALAFLSDYSCVAMIPTNTTGGYTIQNISDPVAPIIDGRSKNSVATAWANSFEGRSEYYLQYGTASTTPSEGLIANYGRSRKSVRWTRHNMANMTAGCVYRSSGQQIQVFGNTSGRVYQMHSTHAREGSAYTGRIYTAAMSQGQPGYMKQYGRVFVDASTTGTYPVTVRTVLGRTNMPTPSGESQTISAGAAAGWGVGLWGSELWGGSGLAGQYVRFNQVARGSYARVYVETTGSTQWFRVNGLTIEAMVTANTIAA